MSRTTPILRGLRKRCPNCGGRGLFVRWFTMKDRCPTCHYSYEREEGYWLGAMVVNIAVAEAAFGLVFIGGMVLTWPPENVPWTLLLVLSLAVNAILPIVFYPYSKTTWAGLDLAFNPPSPEEEAAAIASQSAGAGTPPGQSTER